MNKTEEPRLPADSDVDSRRQILYASLLRYDPAPGSLRDRVVDKLVLGALDGSTKQAPLKVGQVQSRIRIGGLDIAIRPEVLQTSLRRLLSDRKIDQVELKQKHCYFLSDLGLSELREWSIEAGGLFDEACARILTNTESIVPQSLGKAVVRDFLCQSFALFGRQLAQVATRNSSETIALHEPQIRALFDKIASTRSAPPTCIESLRARCIEFLRSTYPNDELLRFNLTQSYYIAQIVGLEPGSFDPLAESAFADSVFYLDSNAIIPWLLAAPPDARVFAEILSVAERLGIRLMVTRATINEIRRVAADRVKELATIVSVVPTEVAKRNGDQFLVGFLEAREIEPAITAEAYMTPFEDLANRLPERFGIELDDVEEDDEAIDLISGKPAELMQQASRDTRGYEKGERALRHDVFHYVHVARKRAINPRTWLLTRDQALCRAADKLDPAAPFSFTVIGFLHSISPFVSADTDRRSLASVLGHFLDDGFSVTGSLFDVQELVVLAEMHEDVLRTPPEKLVQALDYVKQTVLQGRPFSQRESLKVSIGLKKFLTASSDEQVRLLRNETERLRTAEERSREAVVGERALRLLAESDSVALRTANQDLEDRIASLTGSLQSQGNQLDRLSLDMDRQRRRARLVRMVVAIGCAAGASFVADSLAEEARAKWSLSTAAVPVLANALRCSSVGCGFVFVWQFIRKEPWSLAGKAAVAAVFLVAGVLATRLLSPESASFGADVFTIAAGSSFILFLRDR